MSEIEEFVKGLEKLFDTHCNESDCQHKWEYERDRHNPYKPDKPNPCESCNKNYVTKKIFTNYVEEYREKLNGKEM